MKIVVSVTHDNTELTGVTTVRITTTYSGTSNSITQGHGDVTYSATPLPVCQEVFVVNRIDEIKDVERDAEEELLSRRPFVKDLKFSLRRPKAPAFIDGQRRWLARVLNVARQ